MANCGAVCAFCCMFGLPLILQGVGFLTPSWLNDGNCSMQGLFYHCCENGCGTDDTYMNKGALGLQATSFAVLLFIVISLPILMCCEDDDDDDEGVTVFNCIAGCSLLMYPITGLLILIGCILVAADKSASSSLGYSFYLAVAAGCIIILEVIFLCCLVCREVCGDEDTHTSSRNDTDIATTSSSAHLAETRGGYMSRHVAVHEEVHAASNGIVAMVRRTLVITRIHH